MLGSLSFLIKTMYEKKNPEFDETRGSYDGIQFCKLVRLYLLAFLTNRFCKQNIHLYRNNGFPNSFFKVVLRTYQVLNHKN